MDETLHLAVSLVDRYFRAVTTCPRDEFQLVGAAALFTAAKYEQVNTVRAREYACATDATYTKSQILSKHSEILSVVQWRLTVPSSRHFLNRYLVLSGDGDAVGHLAGYLVELALSDYGMLSHKPSLIAAAALDAARLHGGCCWTDPLRRATGYATKDLAPVRRALRALHAKELQAEVVSAIRVKYSQQRRERVATLRLA